MRAALLRPLRRADTKKSLEDRRERARKRRQRKRISSRWLLGLAAGALFVGLPLGVWKGPYLLDGQYLETDSIGEGAGSAALVTGLRTAMVTCVASIGAGIALFYTARNYRLNHQGQVTERFSSALERLDSERIYVRIGGIRALEQIVRDAPEQATDADSVLQHFIRDMQPPEPLSRPTADIQVALTVVTRPENRTHSETQLSFEGACLSGADLNNADLSGSLLRKVNLNSASLNYADVSGATLDEANMANVNMFMANLASARMSGTDIFDAMLNGANLTHALLFRANLVEAYLIGADLSGVLLDEANLAEAQLDSAILVNATLREANLTKVNLDRAALASANLHGAVLIDATLHEVNLAYASLSRANLTGASLRGANLTGTSLDGAKLTNVCLRGADLTGAYLNRVDLRGAEITAQQLLSVSSLVGAQLPQEVAKNPEVTARLGGGLVPGDGNVKQ